jgi:hypothetical protein
MQRTPWKQVLARTGGTIALFAVPALALAWFTPSALSALSVASPSVSEVSAVVAAARATAQPTDAAVLDQFADTAANTAANMTVVTIFHSESAALAAAQRSLLAQLALLTPGTNAYNIVFNELTLVNAYAGSLNTFWHQHGGRGSSSMTPALAASFAHMHSTYLTAQVALSNGTATGLNQSPPSVSQVKPPTAF